jgi:pimeloyl-ACP methyl ester carboxylesterase
LLIHGFPADGTLWDNQLDFLKDRCNLIIPDLPGSGRSAIIENAGIDTYAEIIKIVLDAEIQNTSGGTAKEVIIIGHSMGGYITLAFAEKYPDYLAAFGLFHSSAFADNEEKKESRSKAIRFIRDKGPAAFLKTTVPGMFTKAFAEKYPDKINELIEKGKNFSAGALIQYYEAMRDRPDRIHVLKTFLKPILFIIGEHDTAIPLQTSLQQCYLPAQSHVHILDQSAHMAMWEEKEKANNILADFLVNEF